MPPWSERVDTGDLKSPDLRVVPVRVRRAAQEGGVRMNPYEAGPGDLVAPSPESSRGKNWYKNRKRKKYRVSKSLRARVIERDGLVCKLCERPLVVSEVTMDHIVRLADGGPTTIENLRVACGPCNSTRHVSAADTRSGGRRRRRRQAARKRVVMAHITNENAADFLAKLSAQKQDEELLVQERLRIAVAG